MLTQASSGYEPFTHADPMALQNALRPADVLLVAGNRRISTAIDSGINSCETVRLVSEPD
jgi:hypothetical protein